MVLVGRLVSDPEVKTLEDGKSVSNITLAIPRSYKNENGEYETDFIDCTLWKGVAENTAEYCRKGDVIGVKGRLQSSTYEDKETGNTRKRMDVVAEKVTFLSSKSRDSQERESEPHRSVFRPSRSNIPARGLRRLQG